MLVVSALGLGSASEPTGTVVRVTAVVTNARGEPVAGLRAGDFQVTVDGTPQAVDGAEYRTATSNTPRAFGLVLDQFHVDAADSAAVRDALAPFIDALRPGDVALVFKPLDSLASIRPTADLQALRAAIAGFDGRKGDFTARTVFEQKYMAQAPNAVVAARAQIVSSGLRAVASLLGELPNVRPAVLLVSDGFTRQRADRTLPANLLSAVRIANRGDVPVYVFSPGTAVADPAETEPAQKMLQGVAVQTGGDVFTGITSFGDGLKRMTSDLDAHYVLSYQPPHGDDGRFHSVQVALKRPNARVVRARAGYVAPLAAELRAAAMPSPASTRMLRRSTFIQSWSGVVRTADGKPRVTFTWEPTMRPGNAVPGAAMLVVTASTPNGSVLFDGNVTAVGAAPAPGSANRAEFEAPSGRVLIDIKVLDSKGIVLDTDSRDFEVPKLEDARVTLMPVAVLRVASARQFRTVSEDPEAAPVASREFRRTERLLLRVPAYEPGGAPARVSATLLNRWRQPMRALPAMSVSLPDGVTQFDVPLAPLAPGEYTIRLTAGTVVEHVTFRVRS
jgi:VWFA-related protein